MEPFHLENRIEKRKKKKSIYKNLACEKIRIPTDQYTRSEAHDVWQCHIYANQLKESASDCVIVLYIWVIDSNPFK